MTPYRNPAPQEPPKSKRRSLRLPQRLRTVMATIDDLFDQLNDLTKSEARLVIEACEAIHHESVIEGEYPDEIRTLSDHDILDAIRARLGFGYKIPKRSSEEIRDNPPRKYVR